MSLTVSLSPVATGTRRMAHYDEFLDPRVGVALRKAARVLRGKRVLHVNSTATGGGVAEILGSEIPLLRDLGVDAEWHVLGAEASFYEVTKKIHNGLQGNSLVLDDAEWAKYEETNRLLAEHLQADAWDYVFIHDPQPAAALASVAGRETTTWVWRCHIDSSHPNPHYSERFREYTRPYDAHVYSMSQYVLNGTDRPTFIVPPAIDPLSDKATTMGRNDARNLVAGFGIDVERPLVTQVSRFDPWKDPLGVLDAFVSARKDVPGLQLALIGSSADDDPESKTMLEHVLAATQGKPDVHVLPNRCDDRAVKAFQTWSDVVIQKSLREGFGLTVTEALWAGSPVVGGRAGGIPLQIEHGRHGYLVDTVEECAHYLVDLLRNPVHASEMGEEGRSHVRRNFLLPRLVLDELTILQNLSAGRQGTGAGRRRGRKPSDAIRAAKGEQVSSSSVQPRRHL